MKYKVRLCSLCTIITVLSILLSILPLNTFAASVSVSMTSPSAGSTYTVGQSVTLSARVSGTGYKTTKFFVKTSPSQAGQVYGNNPKTGSTPSDTWNTTGSAAATYYIYAVVYDAKGNELARDSRTIKLTAPNAKVTITAPVNNSSYTVGDKVTLSASVTGSGYSTTKFYVKTSLDEKDHIYGNYPHSGSEPLEVWNTTGVEAGTYYVWAVVYDANGNILDKQYSAFTLNPPESIKIEIGEPSEYMTKNGPITYIVSSNKEIEIDESNIELKKEGNADGSILVNKIDSTSWEVIVSEISGVGWLGITVSVEGDSGERIIEYGAKFQVDNATPDEGVKLSGYISTDFRFSSEAAPYIKSGFIVELIPQTSIMENILQAETDESGYFEIKDIPLLDEGYRMEIKKNYYMSRYINNLVLTEDTEISSQESPIILWAGDFNGDNAINMQDVFQVLKVMNSYRGDDKYIEEYDLDKDNAINMKDLMIIVVNFNSTPDDYEQQ